ncbi:MAG: tyrosine-type recombinase/integrase, partial [Acidimicrobiales bacterium]
GYTLLETLSGLESAAEDKEIMTKMQTVSLSGQDLVLLKKAFTGQLERLSLLGDGFSEEKPKEEVIFPVQKGGTNELVHFLGSEPQKVKGKVVEKVKTPLLSPLVTPGVVIAPNEKPIWLKRIREELEEWVTGEEDLLSHKPLREAWTEAVKIKRQIEEELAISLASSQETILKKQDLAAEKIERLTNIVQDIKDNLQKRKAKKGETKALRGEVKLDLYEALMKAPSPRYTRHAHAKRTRKRIVFTLLYYTGARVNELRRITYNDLIGVIKEGRLKLILHKQKHAIVRIMATVGREAMGKLIPDIESFFQGQGYSFLGESHRKPDQVMHEKAWISYINKEMKKAKEGFKNSDILSSHSFRVGFVTRHLKHADSDLVAKFVGHKTTATTLKYNRYVVDEKREREILDKGYEDQEPFKKGLVHW